MEFFRVSCFNCGMLIIWWKDAPDLVVLTFGAFHGKGEAQILPPVIKAFKFHDVQGILVVNIFILQDDFEGVLLHAFNVCQVF